MSNELLGKCKEGHIFVISAPAGTGKTTLVKMLTDEFPDVVLNVSFTTRKPRFGEKHKEHYYFVDDEEFSRMDKAGEFLESAEHFGSRYAVSKLFVEKTIHEKKHVVLVIDTEGAKKLMRSVNATFIFILPPSRKELERRLRLRATESEERIQERLQRSIEELSAAFLYDYQIINDEICRAYQVLRSIVIAETHKVNKERRVHAEDNPL